MGKILDWLSDLIPSSNEERFRPEFHGNMRYALAQAEARLWKLASDIRSGENEFKNIPLDQRLLMCSGAEHSIQVIKSMIKTIDDLPR